MVGEKRCERGKAVGQFLSVAIGCFLSASLLVACQEQHSTGASFASSSFQQQTEGKMTEQKVTEITIHIGAEAFSVSLENNQAVRELVEMLTSGPLTVTVDDYAGFEKVGNLGRTLTSGEHQMTTHNGDIVLYNSRQLVLFYGSNTWSYTKIGTVKDKENWKQVLKEAGQSLTVRLTLSEILE
ncbi:cyclophilin-like fold protein [Streptococcus cuniculi]|uniref:Cyclophilin-like domain-containing protein n=1 Tax=Streptococcus cuniculi TaxID=1432788 RepID=A0A4Y9JA48_9STRE|nr:cyclophilin-like fold protein [Streptococcus cuniculi]MBF0779168.1 hypothetical protein [Streptococcus cuniculi]TFU96829.1 hypothetical protein E4T82_10665 [Streptococcus cuniculi]